jgi:hypothetical protein
MAGQTEMSDNDRKLNGMGSTDRKYLAPLRRHCGKILRADGVRNDQSASGSLWREMMTLSEGSPRKGSQDQEVGGGGLLLIGNIGA